MAYHERGEGAPVLFLHGNPTSSYLWRDVIPELEGRGRLIAPDLIGMGDSAKLPNPGPDTYRFTTHRKYLGAFIDAVIGPAESIVLVVHDWGSALGFDWANHHRDRIRGIAYMEAIVRPVASWDEWSAVGNADLPGVSLRQGRGDDPRPQHVRRAGVAGVGAAQTDRGRDGGISPALPAKREDRWPTLTWPRQIPIAGEPADVVQIVADYSQWMARERYSKAVRQCRARRDPDRCRQGFLPKLEKPDRSHRTGLAFHPGRIPGRRSAGRWPTGSRQTRSEDPDRGARCPDSADPSRSPG